jgi:hypothetical protein
MKLFSKLAIHFTVTAASESHEWGYLKNGADWPELEISENKCGSSNQSPINLVSLDSPSFKYKVYDDEKDMFTKSYSN